ncbi:MAG: radical SAM protein [Xanthomonadales bacterium]|nr:radical SAM protein [Xanthomonadales bacterium]
MTLDPREEPNSDRSASVSGCEEEKPGESRGRLLKKTGSICPRCLEDVSATVRERDGEVWMDKRCPEHGEFSALLSSASRHYYRALENPPGSAACCGSACGAPDPSAGALPDSGPWANHSCTVLIEIIERCNLTCPTCFAGSSPQHEGLMSLETFTHRVQRLAQGGKTGADMIQLSGGEPTIHPRLPEMLDLLFENGFKQVTINSNGIKLAQADYVRRLAACAARWPGAQLFVYLQFDGFDERTQETLRGRRDLLEIKRRAILNCQSNGISVHPVMTLTRGINEHEVGDFVRLAVDNPQLKNVVIQPAMYSGRYDNPRHQDRITLADTVRLICDQFGTFEADDFGPIPCSDPNCFGMAVAFRTSSGLVPVSRYFPPYETWNDEEARPLIEEFADTINGPDALSAALRWAAGSGDEGGVLEELGDDQVEALLDALVAAQSGDGDLWDRLLTISIKPFMDAWTYDQDRIDACCVHILDPDGEPVSFCEYNAVRRPRLDGSARPGNREAAAIQVIDA